jgi:hypothetical protein
MNEHLLRRWAAITNEFASPTGTKRFQHVFLSPDALAAHEQLLGLSMGGRHTGARRHTAAAGEYDHARLQDLIANEGFSHHPDRGAAPSSGWMASYHAPEGSGVAAVHHISEITPEHIAAHREAAAGHLNKEKSYQGGWHDTATGDVYLDASKHFDDDDEEGVRNFAADQKQKAYFHLNDFSERFMDPKQDPTAMKDHSEWQQRYSKVGTEPHPRWGEYSHLYPHTDEQREFWGQQGHHLGSKGPLEGIPAGPWLSNSYVEQELARRHGYW